ncbi:hypothetical protein ACLKA7_010124 [Drosophila subpalustris]
MQLLLKFLLFFLLRSAAGIVTSQQQQQQRLFAYERGKCDTAVSEVIEDLARSLFNRPMQQTQASLLQYDLYTPLNPYQRQLLQPGDVNMLKRSNFNAKWPVRIAIHGWTGKSSHCYNAALKDAYLSRGNFNVIIMDWSRQAIDIRYYRVSKQLKSIATSLAKFLRFLHDNTGMPYGSVYLVGHSAGTHISGLTGKLFKAPGQRLGAIIALDPAGLTQLALGPTERLAPTDALYVESIHTDVTFFGNPQGNGLSQAAFFVNWGRGQTHCPNATATELDFACDHFSAVYYFAESVRRPKSFGALRCDSLKSVLTATCSCKSATSSNHKTLTCPAEAFMGGDPAIPKKGIYYLSTRSKPPFGTADGQVHMQPPIPTRIFETTSSKRRHI